MPPVFRLVGEGFEEVSGRFDASANQALNARPIFEDIFLDMLDVEKRVISSGGRRGGGSWARLKEDTVRKKGDTEILRTRFAKPGYSRLGNDTLFKSVTELGAPHQIKTITRRSVEFGTDRPYAGVHQFGSSDTPARPFIRFLASDTERWSNMLLAHLMAPFNAKATKAK